MDKLSHSIRSLVFLKRRSDALAAQDSWSIVEVPRSGLGTTRICLIYVGIYDKSSLACEFSVPLSPGLAIFRLSTISFAVSDTLGLYTLRFCHRRNLSAFPWIPPRKSSLSVLNLIGIWAPGSKGLFTQSFPLLCQCIVANPDSS